MQTFVIPFRGASVFRKHQNHFLREYAKKMAPKTVLNLGATPDASDKEGSVYESYFSSAEFKTLDLGPFDHPRHIHGDLMDLPNSMPDYDLVLAMSVIEHIDKPWLAAPNIVRLVRPGGFLYVAMPFFYPVHEGPYYGDHWRATPSGIGHLFSDMEIVRRDYYPSSIRAVHDRKSYWNDANSTYAGFSMLLRRADV
ncbi:class I SAM-dependent methyltransferase [Devosia sp. XJ19-1]|uniref:Class I SAM-dependent methyltransferase n=1 Tax=Devosia ureilytica TaxID=2952754 RepID=A0A9Q4AKS6_9HYPH|nr:methyltransferase domain-containing protein [Devosia ureilytica]MCP8882618.1 class I SAM-dependent methyltransferase [Devosia ureilytica]MCP8885495.1 class I SAM-dependent methyltransferase [Devosia ureilytica]